MHHQKDTQSCQESCSGVKRRRRKKQYALEPSRHTTTKSAPRAALASVIWAVHWLLAAQSQYWLALLQAFSGKANVNSRDINRMCTPTFSCTCNLFATPCGHCRRSKSFDFVPEESLRSMRYGQGTFQQFCLSYFENKHNYSSQPSILISSHQIRRDEVWLFPSPFLICSQSGLTEICFHYIIQYLWCLIDPRVDCLWYERDKGVWCCVLFRVDKQWHSSVVPRTLYWL